MKSNICSVLTVGGLVAGVSLIPMQTVHAQGARFLEEVVVTARKREETLQEVPVAVSVLTGDAIKSQRIESIVDLSTVVPGMVASQVTSGTSGVIYLRGIGTSSSNPTFDQAVAINVDGMGINSAQLMNVGMFDLKQIEVLRGPQALFFGKNSPGGVIAIHTNDPGDEFELELSGMYETTSEETSLRGIISAPINDTLGVRLAFGASEADEHWYDVYGEDRFENGPAGPIQTAFKPDNIREENTFLLGTVLWEPTDNFSAKLKIAHIEDEQKGPIATTLQKVWCPNGTPQAVQYQHPNVEGCDGQDKLAIGAGQNPVLSGPLRDGQHAGRTEGFSKRETDFASLTMDYEMDNGLTFTSVTGFFENEDERLGESSYEIASALPNSPIATLDQFTQELRVVSNFDGNLNFSMGAFFETKDISYETDVIGGFNRYAAALIPLIGNGPFNFGRHAADQEATAWSVFAQVGWDINEQWNLSLGGRYSKEEKELTMRGRLQATVPFGLPDVPWTDVVLTDPKLDWSNFSPEVTLSYQHSDDIMFFASYKEGFKSGGFDTSYRSYASADSLGGLLGGVPQDNTYNEELVEGFEVGMKSMLLDGTLRFNVTAYSYDYTDLQLGRFDGTTLSFSIFNGGEASADGLEIETFWVTPVEGLSLTTNIAFADSKFDSFFAPCWAGQTIDLGCTALPHPVTGNFTSVDKSGESLPYASDVSATVGVDYEVSLSDNWNLGLNFNGVYTDDYNPHTGTPPAAGLQDAFWRLNAGLVVYSSDDKWEIFVRGVNLTDEIQYISGTVAPGQGGGDLTTGTNDPSLLGDWMNFPIGGRYITAGLTWRM